MTVKVNDVVLGVDPAVIIEQLDTIAPQERLALAKALASCDSVDVVWFENNDEPQLIIVPIQKMITRLGPGAGKYMGKGDRSEAGRYAANVRWAGHNAAKEGKKTLPPGVKEVRTGGRPGQIALDYTEAFNPEHPDPAAGEKRAAAVADPEFHGGMTPLNPEGEDSLSQFAVMEQGPDGKMQPKRNEFGEIVYSPERQALHDKIIEDAFMQKDAKGNLILGADGKPVPIAKSANPTATFTGGGPASGKSTAVEAGLIPAPSQSTSVHVNPDEIKGSLPEYRAMARAGDPSLANFAHEESSDLSKRMMREAKQRGLDILLDGTGDSSLVKLEKKVQPLQEAGYKVEGYYVTLPTDVAVKLAETRGEKMLPIPGAKIGRVVPPSVVRETHANVSVTLRQAIEADLFDSVVLIDNTVQGKPKQVVSKTKGQKHEMYDERAWDDFMNKQYVTSLTNATGARSRIVQARNTEDNAIRD